LQKAFVGVVAYLFSTFSAYCDVEHSYSGYLKRLPDGALFSFFPINETLTFPESRNFFRIWGADVSVELLPDEILADKFLCKHVGAVFARGFGDAYIVSCSQNGADLAEILIRRGYAKEICAETRNMYGTCEGVRNRQ
jgi:hypothetical protein